MLAEDRLHSVRERRLEVRFRDAMAACDLLEVEAGSGEQISSRPRLQVTPARLGVVHPVDQVPTDFPRVDPAGAPRLTHLLPLLRRDVAPPRVMVQPGLSCDLRILLGTK